MMKDQFTDMHRSAFASFFQGGFECSSHRRFDGERLDLISATRHDKFAEDDYSTLRSYGVRTVRDGLRWHLIEQQQNGQYDWSSLLPILRAARVCGSEVIWDLCHYGWPDHIDIWDDSFVSSFASFSASAAEVIARECPSRAIYCPINEISFWAWAGGEMGRINPYGLGRGDILKKQLCKAAIQATKAIRQVDPRARFVTAEPLIRVVPSSSAPEALDAAEAYHASQFEAVDILLGMAEPQLGGNPSIVDLVGLNFYPQNQWYHGGPTIPFGQHAFRPLNEMLKDVFRRWGMPLFISETGAEGSCRASWLHYVADEVSNARRSHVPVSGICLYPIVDYPDWEDDRSCEVGLISPATETGKRSIHKALADELLRQQALLEML